MSIPHAVILGLIQGATEFLPVSSSGHLIFIPKLFGWADQGIGFDIIVHLGTLCAVVYYFRSELLQFILAVLRPSQATQENRRLAYLLMVSLIPAATVGILAGNYIEALFRTPLFVGVNLIVWGIILWIADLNASRRAHRRFEELTLRDTIIIGSAQALALVPGTSRSGITMTAGMFSGFAKQSAATLAFLMSVPIIVLAGADGIRELIIYGPDGAGIAALIAGFVSAALGGFAAIWMLMSIIRRWNFTPFVVYRIAVGAFILFFLL